MKDLSDLHATLGRENLLAHVMQNLQPLDNTPPPETDTRAERVKASMERLRTVAFDVDTPPPHEPTVLWMGGVEVCHAGNLSLIEAHIKSGKSALIAAGLASIMAQVDSEFLGWTSDKNLRGSAVIHFDSEQSRGGADKLIRRSLARAGLARPPAWFASYGFTGWSITEMRTAIEDSMIDGQERFGGVHSVWIDGLADLVLSPNDEAECFAFVRWLQEKAIEFHCPIIGVIHLNPGDSGKSRGHLGSELNRKSETMLRVIKDANEISTITTPHGGRGAPIPANSAPRFAWSDEHERHVSITTAVATKESKRRDEYVEVAQAMFEHVPAGIGMGWADAVKALEGVCDIKKDSAISKLKTMLTAGAVHKDKNGRYQLSTL